MRRHLLKNATIVTGSTCSLGHLAIEGERIREIHYGPVPSGWKGGTDLGGKILMAGGIDAHVHFREPGMTWKADMASESAAALIGGITSFVDMPNTIPQTVNLTALEDKLKRAEKTSLANYGFHLGATNDNVAQIRRYIDLGLGGRFAGIKVFMGSSTGNMLVDSDNALEDIFRIKGKTILVHSEDEGIIRQNLEAAVSIHGNIIPFRMHPVIRSREACIESTRKALSLAVKHRTRLHILHVSTAEEVEMIRAAKRTNPKITAETSANYLWFCDEDYDRMGGRLKCNPSIKARTDLEALIKGLADGTIDTVGSDHAPHLLEEKDKPYLKCPSGLPTIQQSLPVVFNIARANGIPLQRIASAFSERPAGIFGICDRGFIKEGCYADLVVIDPDKEYVVGSPASKCGWSPFEGCRLKGSVDMVWINGSPAVSGGKLCTDHLSLIKRKEMRFLSRSTPSTPTVTF